MNGPRTAGAVCLAMLLAGLPARVSHAQMPAQPPPLPPPAAQLPAPAQVPAPADPFRISVDEAARQIDTDARAAMEALDHLAVESTELRKTRPLTGAERPAHRLLFVLRARVHLQAMNDEKVNDSYRELLRIDPFFNEALAPREQELLDGLRTRESGLLEVSSSVRDCTVLVDGMEVGATGDMPVRASIVNGTYELRLEKPGYRGVGTRVTIATGETLKVTDLAPQPQVPPVAFLADRAGVAVVVDNVAAGQTVPIADLKRQLSADEVSALDQALSSARFDPATSAGFLLRDPPVDRSVMVQFRGDCLIEESRTIAITAGALATLDATSALLWYGDTSAVRLRPDVGALRVSSVPGDADVFLNGALAGRTPFERSVCTGEYRVRVRHRIGSYATTATIRRGRTEVIDVTLKPGLALLGAFESAAPGPRPSPELTSRIDRALATSLQNFRMATMIDLPPELQRWNDTSTADLISAAGREDSEALKRLLRLAHDNYDAPLLLAANSSDPATVDLLLFWYDRVAVDRVRLPRGTPDALEAAIRRIDGPADPRDLVFQNALGVRVADTALPEAPLILVSVEPGSPAALAGLKAGDAVTEVDGAPATAAQLADRVRQKKPGDIVTIKAGSKASPAALPVQRRARQAPAFDPEVPGNALTATLIAASAVAAEAAERELLNLSLGLVQMRFGQWASAVELFDKIGRVPDGVGVGPASRLYLKAMCFEGLGELDRARALLREASAAAGEAFADDGSTVGALATLRLAALK